MTLGSLLLLLALDGSVDHKVGEVDVALGLFSLQRRKQQEVMKPTKWLYSTSCLRLQHQTFSACHGTCSRGRADRELRLPAACVGAWWLQLWQADAAQLYQKPV